MAAITITVKASDDGTITLPMQSVESLGLHPGDEVHLSIQTESDTDTISDVDDAETLVELFEEAATLVPEPGRPLTDPLKAIWGEGVEEKFARMGLKL